MFTWDITKNAVLHAISLTVNYHLFTRSEGLMGKMITSF